MVWAIAPSPQLKRQMYLTHEKDETRQDKWFHFFEKTRQDKWFHFFEKTRQDRNSKFQILKRQDETEIGQHGQNKSRLWKPACLFSNSGNNQSEVVHTIQQGNNSNYCLFVMLHFTNNVARSHRDNNNSLNNKSSVYYVLNTIIIS
jgi:hypothetical protein